MLTKTVKNASLNEKRRKRGGPLEKDMVDESLDAAERERTYDELKRKIDSELTSTQKYILEEKEYGGLAAVESSLTDFFGTDTAAEQNLKELFDR